MKCMMCGSGNAQSYNLGMHVRGRLCSTCMESAARDFAKWSVKRGGEIQAERLRAADAQQAAFDLAAEALPLSTRRALRDGGRAA